MLRGSCEGIADAGQKMSRTRYSFNEIRNRLGRKIEVNDKPLLPLLYVYGSSGVHEAEASRAVHNFLNAAEIYRPKAGCVSFYSY